MADLTTKTPGASFDDVPDIGLFKTPGEALKAVLSGYDYWSGNLTTSSLQMNYALIGANWIIFGSVNGIIGSGWAKWSMLLVLVALVVNVIGSWILSELLRKRVSEAEGNYSGWAEQFQSAYGTKTSWPFTDVIDNIARWMRWTKAGLTTLSGICLIVGAILKSVAATKL